MLRVLVLYIFSLVLLSALPAWAQYCRGEAIDTCSSGQAGAMHYDENHNMYAFCNGTDWLTVESLADISGGVDTPCPGIGVMEYDTTGHYYRFCNHKDVWKKVSQGVSLFGAVCTGEGKIEYDTTYKMMKYCNGTNWIIMAQRDESLTVGDRCIDGSIYAGLSADGNRWMFAMPCDQGQTYSGGLCGGARSGFTWDDGLGNFEVTNYTSTSDGDGNTAGLVALATDYMGAMTCDSLTFGSRSDWYLPAYLELETLYTGRVAIGNFATVVSPSYIYWSSTERALKTAYSKDFATAAIGNDSKTFSRLVRCVRNEVPSILSDGVAEN